MSAITRFLLVAGIVLSVRSAGAEPRQDPGKSAAGGGAAEETGSQPFWSFQPLRQPAVPKSGQGWATNAIDRFVAARQQEAGITSGKEARPGVLLRRAWFDLSGLPPSSREVEAWGEVYSDTAYESLIDRLLAKPQFGERWARYWLDVARFAESSGFEMDQDRPDAWHYRDFVIRAFNEDMPFDEFVRLQLAGDHLYPGDSRATVATGFLVAGVQNLIQTRKDFVQQRYDKIDDFVSTVGTGLLGLSLGCARCHDHKYDPVSQREYYQVAAAFASTISAVKPLKRDDKTFKSFVATEAADNRIHMSVSSEPSFKGLPSIPAKVHFLVRGDPSNQREAVETGFPHVLVRKDAKKWITGAGDDGPVPGRVALARWITDSGDGAGDLLARVIVNRLWHHHFGRGLVATPSDFGTRGEPPTHPDLLDWLAGTLIRNEWRLKPIHKLIMMSATYRQAFRGAADHKAIARHVERDPANLLLWRREPRRLDAEAIRDNLLSVSGRLDPTMFGPGTLEQDHPRRSVYLTVKRSRMIPWLQLFDAPDSLQGIGQRQTTTTAPQGLAMLNSPFADGCVVALASRLEARKLGGAEAYIREGFLLAVGREPSAEETELCRQLLRPGNMEAKRDFCQMLLCLNEFITIE